MGRLTGEVAATPTTITFGNVTISTTSGETLIDQDSIKTKSMDDDGNNLSHLFEELLYELRMIRSAAEESVGHSLDIE